MKKILFKPELFAVLAITLFFTSCDKKTDTNNVTPTEKEDVSASISIDLAISNMITYHDSTYLAKMHSSKHMYHYDSIYHHHDSLYNYHHAKYHHGDTAHHHFGYHHTQKQHHLHDSLNNAHHHSIH
jgi:hypothetical protein